MFREIAVLFHGVLQGQGGLPTQRAHGGVGAHLEDAKRGVTGAFGWTCEIDGESRGIVFSVYD